MSDNLFFKPTLLYKEFMILDLIEKDANITQREISKIIGVAVSMTNAYIENFVEKGLIKKKKHSTKTVDYFVTKKGSERKSLLNLNYLHNTQLLYNSAKKNIKLFMETLYKQKVKKLIIYGAGKVANIILNMMYSENLFDLFDVMLIDDDVKKNGESLYNLRINSFSIINKKDYDAILIGSYTYREEMVKKLVNSNVKAVKIINIFNTWGEDLCH